MEGTPRKQATVVRGSRELAAQKASSHASRKREYDYFSACGVGDSSGVADGAAVGLSCGDDAGNACGGLGGSCKIRATSIGTITAAATAERAQNSVFRPSR